MVTIYNFYNSCQVLRLLQRKDEKISLLETQLDDVISNFDKLKIKLQDSDRKLKESSSQISKLNASTDLQKSGIGSNSRFVGNLSTTDQRSLSPSITRNINPKTSSSPRPQDNSLIEEYLEKIHLLEDQNKSLHQQLIDVKMQTLNSPPTMSTSAASPTRHHAANITPHDSAFLNSSGVSAQEAATLRDRNEELEDQMEVGMTTVSMTYINIVREILGCLMCVCVFDVCVHAKSVPTCNYVVSKKVLLTEIQRLRSQIVQDKSDTSSPSSKQNTKIVQRAEDRDM